VKNWGIRTRVLLLALLPAVTIAVTLSGYGLYRASSNLERDLRDYGFGLSRQLAAVSEFSTYSGDHQTLQQIARAALAQNLVTAVSFFDREGIPIASSNGLPAPLTLPSNATGPLLVGTDETRLLFAAPIIRLRYEGDDPFLPESSRQPKQTKTTLLGWVTLELSRAARRQRMIETVFFTLLSTLVVLTLGGLLAIFLGRQVTRPIIRLENAVSRIQAGHLDERVPADSGGDLQRLEEGMNAMAEALSENRQQLEARVRTTTHKLEQKMHEAESASVAKSRFLAAASHDLRQPLHALSLFSADLRLTADTPARKKIASHIQDSVSGMSELLDSLLDISRLDVAGVTPVMTDIPLTDVFQRLDAIFAQSAAAKSLRFLCRPSPFWIHTDPVLFERLLSNLLSNAIRYTAKGGVMMIARKRKDQVCIEIRDSGIGIAEAHHEAVFEEFFQVENTARVQGKGLGLGLSIVSRLVRILGGNIELRSAPGRGSVFAVSLPLVIPANRHPALHLPPAALEPAPVRLLLIRPETPALKQVALLASSWGFSSEWANSLEEAQSRALPESVVMISMAETPAPGTAEEIITASIALALLDNTDKNNPASTYALPLPLRPAKLRALLAQLLTADVTV
jgi:signal transduction histidine kinase